MYIAYFVNTITGELFRSATPRDNPSGTEWKRIDETEYNIMILVANFYSFRH